MRHGLRRLVAAWFCGLFVAGTFVPGIREQAHAADAAPPIVHPVRIISDLGYGFLPRPWARAGYFSSYDRIGGNDDGFRGTYSALSRLANGEHVIVDLQGPGCLYTLWFTGPAGGFELPWGTLRFYLDDEPEPRLEATGEQLFSGMYPGFPRPLVADSYTSTGGHVSWVPIPFAKRLIVTTEDRAGFYNAYYQLYPAGTQIESWTGREDLSSAVQAWNAVGAEPAQTRGTRWYRGTVEAPGYREPAVDLVKLTSRGVITAIRLNPERPQSPASLNNLWLRIWWDGQETPAVDVPIGPFFGSGQGEHSVRALPIGMSPNGFYYCYFPMPFEAGARIALENRQYESQGSIRYEIAVDESPHGTWAECAERFHAVYRRAWPTTAGQDFIWLNLKQGQGLVAGFTLTVDPWDADNRKWWEGDLRVWVDGCRHPFLHGTGHEDELLGGWSSRWLQGPYSLPMHGLGVSKLFWERSARQWNGAITAYRFFAGGIPFRHGVRMSIEHGVDNKVITLYAGVAYYYYRPESAMRQTDVLDVGDEASETAHEYQARGGVVTEPVTGPFDGDQGRPGAEPLTDVGRRAMTRESFTVAIDPTNAGVLLRRLYWQGDGLHRALLTVDGQPVGIVQNPDDNRVHRWREDQLIVPATLTAGKKSLTFEFVCQQGSWNAFRYTAWSLGE